MSKEDINNMKVYPEFNPKDTKRSFVEPEGPIKPAAAASIEEPVNMEIFRRDITDFIEQAKHVQVGLSDQKDEEARKPLEIDVNYLLEEDARIWRKVKNKTITQEEFRIYQVSVIASGTPSRKVLMEAMANLMESYGEHILNEK